MKNLFILNTDTTFIDRSDTGIVIMANDTIYIFADLEAAIWEMLEQQQSLEQIIDSFTQEYANENSEVISSDITSFVTSLLEANLLTEQAA